MKTLVLALLMSVCVGCNNGLNDGSEHISNGYYFSHMGAYENSINYRNNGKSHSVIDSKVEEFVVHGRVIYVSRRPVIYERDGGSSLANSCEYWTINLDDGVVEGPFTWAAVQNQSKWTLLQKRNIRPDFGNTVCHLYGNKILP